MYAPHTRSLTVGETPLESSHKFGVYILQHPAIRVLTGMRVGEVFVRRRCIGGAVNRLRCKSTKTSNNTRSHLHRRA